MAADGGATWYVQITFLLQPKLGRISILNANFVFTETQRPPNKRRKRKGSQTGGGAGGGISGNPGPGAPAVPNNKKRSPGPNFSLASQVSNGTGKVLISIIQHYTTNTQIVHTNTLNQIQISFGT